MCACARARLHMAPLWLWGVSGIERKQCAYLQERLQIPLRSVTLTPPAAWLVLFLSRLHSLYYLPLSFIEKCPCLPSTKLFLDNRDLRDWESSETPLSRASPFFTEKKSESSSLSSPLLLSSALHEGERVKTHRTFCCCLHTYTPPSPGSWYADSQLSEYSTDCIDLFRPPSHFLSLLPQSIILPSFDSFLLLPPSISNDLSADS